MGSRETALAVSCWGLACILLGGRMSGLDWVRTWLGPSGTTNDLLNLLGAPRSSSSGVGSSRRKALGYGVIARPLLRSAPSCCWTSPRTSNCGVEVWTQLGSTGWPTSWSSSFRAKIPNFRLPPIPLLNCSLPSPAPSTSRFWPPLIADIKCLLLLAVCTSIHPPQSPPTTLYHQSLLHDYP